MKVRYITQTILDNYMLERLEELEQVKENIYNANLDSLTCRMTRKKALGTWTEQDELAYNEAYKHCMELIKVQEAKAKEVPDNIQIVSDEEYAKLLEEMSPKPEAEATSKEDVIADVKEDTEVKEVVNGE